MKHHDRTEGEHNRSQKQKQSRSVLPYRRQDDARARLFDARSSLEKVLSEIEFFGQTVIDATRTWRQDGIPDEPESSGHWEAGFLQLWSRLSKEARKSLDAMTQALHELNHGK